MNRWISVLALLTAVSAEARIVDVGVSSATIVAGKDVEVSVTVDRPAPAAGLTMAVSCDPARVYAVPTAMQIAPKATSGWITLRPRPVLIATPLLVTFTSEDSSKSIEIDVQPAQFYRLITDWNVIGGSPVRLSILFAGIPAPGQTIALQSDDPMLLPVPATIPADESEIRIPSKRVTEEKLVTITARYRDATSTAGVYLRPVTLADLTGPADAASGSKVQIKINLTQPAVFGREVIKLTSSNEAVVRVPATIAVPANASFSGLDVIPGRVRVPTPVTITAALGAVKKTFTLTVKPKP